MVELVLQRIGITAAALVYRQRKDVARAGAGLQRVGYAVAVGINGAVGHCDALREERGQLTAEGGHRVGYRFVGPDAHQRGDAAGGYGRLRCAFAVAANQRIFLHGASALEGALDRQVIFYCDDERAAVDGDLVAVFVGRYQAAGQIERQDLAVVGAA